MTPWNQAHVNYRKEFLSDNKLSEYEWRLIDDLFELQIFHTYSEREQVYQAIIGL